MALVTWLFSGNKFKAEPSLERKQVSIEKNRDYNFRRFELASEICSGKRGGHGSKRINSSDGHFQV